MNLYIYFWHDKTENTYFSFLFMVSSGGKVCYASKADYDKKTKLLEAALRLANTENATLIAHEDTNFSEFWEYICK